MSDRLNEVSPGDAISADQHNLIVKAVGAGKQLSSGISGSAFTVTRPVGVTLETTAVIIERCNGSFRMAVQDLETEDGDRLSENVGKVALIQDEDSGNPIETWKVLSVKETGGGVGDLTLVGFIEQCPSEENMCYDLTPCGAGSAIVTNNNVVSNFTIVRLDDNNCYTVTENSDCTGAVSVNVTDGFTNCSECDCLTLDDCHSAEQFYVYSTPSLLAQVGNVIKSYGRCYTVSGSVVPCVGSPITLADNEWTTQTDCNSCKCYIFSPCAGGASVIFRSANIDLSAVADGTTSVYVTYGAQSTPVCGTLQESTTEDCSTGVVATVVKVFDKCHESAASADFSCSEYELIPYPSDCGTAGTAIYTITNLAARFAGVAGERWIRLDDGICYYINAKNNATLSGTVQEVTIDSEYASCAECIAPEYRLSPDCTQCDNCNDDEGSPPTPKSDILTNHDFSNEVNQYIKLSSDDTCYYVTENSPQEGAVNEPSSFDFSGPFSDCTSCGYELICAEFITKIDWDAKKVTKTRYMISAMECEETEEDIPTTDCDEEPAP